MAQNVPNYVPTNGLVGWWPFNGNANDESGNGNHGTVNSWATLTTDRFGKSNTAYNFSSNNGTSEGGIVCNKFNFSSNSITISFWYQISKNPISNDSRIISHDWQIPGGCFVAFVQPSMNLGTCVMRNLNNQLEIFDIAKPNFTDWYNIVIQYDGLVFNLFRNGELVNSQSDNSSLQHSIANLLFGGNYYGKIDDIAIYNRALTQEEITALYTSTPPCINPTATITPQGNTTFCQGGFVNLNASTGANYTYEWYNNGQLINGATASVYQASASGNYTVKVIDGACDATSTVTTVMVNPNPTATITPQGNTTFCQGGFVNLVASGGTSYQWNTGSSAATISATQSGAYTVNVFNFFGCQATASQQVIVNPLPNVTLNALNQFTLKNASPIQLVANPTGGTFSGEGVQGSTFNPANVTLGKKTITYNYTSPQGCSGQALINTIIADTLGNVCSTYDTLKVKFKLTTGIKANQYTTMNVYPNPTSDVIIIDASDVAALNGYSYKLFDVQGKEAYNALVTNAKTEISMITFGKAGVYILHVVDANNVSIETKQLVLE